MFVGIAKLSLVIGDSHSLKDKRMVVRRIKDRVRARLGVIVNEVGDPATRDAWQRAELGVAIASGDRAKALELIDQVVRVAMAAGGAEIAAIARDVQRFEGEFVPFAPVDDRTGAADKALAAGGNADADWVPDEWREEAGK